MAVLRRLWQLLTIDVPWAISNWLWANVVTPLMAEMGRLTLRRLFYLGTFAILCVAITWAAAEFMFPADVVLMLASDSALYFEIMTFAYIALVRARVHRAMVPVTQIAYFALRRTLIRVAARARRPMRGPRLFDKEDSGDVPDGAPIFTYAFA